MYKINSIPQRVFLFVVCIFISIRGYATDILDIAVLHASEKEGSAYALLTSQFENTYPGTIVRLHTFDDSSYKKRLNSLITDGRMDVVYWQAGSRLFRLSKLLSPLNKLWAHNEFDRIYSSEVKTMVSDNGVILGLPYTYYGWGFFYNTKLYQRLNIEPPATIEAFISQCKRLKDEGIAPLTLPFKQKWPVLAWFDYLILRNYDVEFRQQLALGEISFLDERVKHLFQQWRKIIVNCKANDNFELTDWKHSVNHILTGKAAATLGGSFIQQHISQKNIDNVDFFPFPMIVSDIEKVEIAPAEVWTIPKNAKNKELAEKFIAFAAAPEIQEPFNQLLGYLPANAKSHIFGNHLTVATGKNLQKAKHYVQYLDRITAPEFAAQKTLILLDFVAHPDSSKVTEELEKIRLKIFKAED